MRKAQLLNNEVAIGPLTGLVISSPAASRDLDSAHLIVLYSTRVMFL